jgi:hypothetical protein
MKTQSENRPVVKAREHRHLRNSRAATLSDDSCGVMRDTIHPNSIYVAPQTTCAHSYAAKLSHRPLGAEVRPRPVLEGRSAEAFGSRCRYLSGASRSAAAS